MRPKPPPSQPAPSYLQPRIAETIATEVRNQILDGTIADGALLPPQDELLDTFHVSLPSLRGALQILETEGLITVRRGKVGGAIVHVPTSRTVAYNVGLVLHAGCTPLTDVAEALQHLESLCVGLCSRRTDRHETVVPALRHLIDDSRDALDDIEHVTAIAREFHEQLVAQCGNATLILIVGALEALWSAHEHEWVSVMSRTGAVPARDEREDFVAAHEEIIVAIEQGDPVHAAAVARDHLRAAERPLIARGSARVNASLLQRPRAPVRSPVARAVRAARGA